MTEPLFGTNDVVIVACRDAMTLREFQCGPLVAQWGGGAVVTDTRRSGGITLIGVRFGSGMELVVTATQLTLLSRAADACQPTQTIESIEAAA